MPSPFGQRRSASMYYQNAGRPYSYLVNWDGMPQGGVRSAEAHELGDDDYIDVQFQGHLRKSLGGLGDYKTYDVALTSETGEKSVLHQVDQSHLYDAPPWQGLGFFGNLSDNEKKLAVIAAIGIGGYLLWKKRRRR